MSLPITAPTRLRPVTPSAVGAVITALAAVTALLRPPGGRESPRPPAATAPSANRLSRPRHGALFPAERVIVSPLSVGDALGPARVFELAHHADARIMVGLRVGAREAWLRIHRAAGGERRARVVVGPFALTVEPGALTERELDAAVTGLAAVLRRNVGAPLPPELQPIRESAP